ncbi:hypothetical protein Q2430_27630 [Escherichia coli]|nr:hypothetical protein [Escherichia coli]
MLSKGVSSARLLNLIYA